MRAKILLFVLLTFHVFFMFYNLEKWASFGWDQVDNAWVAMKIITLQKYPLVGMVAKQNSGMYIGPLYYYYAAVFYRLTNLDPVASPVIAGVTSILGFFVIYLIAKKLFGGRVALMSLFIYTFSVFIIGSERVQWPVNFIAPIGLLIFYSLSQIMEGKPRYFLHLGILIGLAMNVHFTAVFYLVITVLVLPFVRWKKESVRLAFVALITSTAFISPVLAAKRFSGFSAYAGSYFIGFHPRRFIGFIFDAFIRFQSVLEIPYRFLRNASFTYAPVFAWIYLRKTKQLRLIYLLALWIAVPWIVLSSYGGEVSDYYFNGQLYVAVIIFAYLTVWIWDRKQLLTRVAIAAFWWYWLVVNVRTYLRTPPTDFIKNRGVAQASLKISKRIEFTEGDPRSYFYYFLSFREKKWLPYQL